MCLRAAIMRSLKSTMVCEPNAVHTLKSSQWSAACGLKNNFGEELRFKAESKNQQCFRAMKSSGTNCKPPLRWLQATLTSAVAETNTLHSEVIKNAEKSQTGTEFIMKLNQQREMLDSSGDPRLRAFTCILQAPLTALLNLQPKCTRRSRAYALFIRSFKTITVHHVKQWEGVRVRVLAASHCLTYGLTSRTVWMCQIGIEKDDTFRTPWQKTAIRAPLHSLSSPFTCLLSVSLPPSCITLCDRNWISCQCNA